MGGFFRVNRIVITSEFCDGINMTVFNILLIGRIGQPCKQYVYEYLKDQPIW